MKLILPADSPEKRPLLCLNSQTATANRHQRTNQNKDPCPYRNQRPYQHQKAI